MLAELWTTLFGLLVVFMDVKNIHSTLTPDGVVGLYLYCLRKAFPAVGYKSPVSILKVVVFPAPFTPNNPKH